MDCKNCDTELTEMKNGKGETTCLRCLKCHPITKYVPPKDKEAKYVDVPWTDERVIEVIDRVVPAMIREVLENWPTQKHVEPIDWRVRAKELGIEVYDKENKKPRLKIDVLAEIAEKTKCPEQG